MRTAQTTVGEWVLVTDPDVFVGDEAGGDVQIGEGHSIRWLQAQPDGSVRQITRTYYGAQMSEAQGFTGENLVNNGEPYIEEQTEYQEWDRHPDDGYAQEGCADYRYRVYRTSYDQESDTYQAAVQAITDEPPYDEEWDDAIGGKEHWGHRYEDDEDDG